jgi:hypothetical protein
LNDVKGLVKAMLAGFITALGTALVIMPLFAFDLITMPEPPSQAFAETLLGPVHPYVGFLFHVGDVTLVAGGFLIAVGPRPSFWKIAARSIGLWMFAIISFFPIIGWGVGRGNRAVKRGARRDRPARCLWCNPLGRLTSRLSRAECPYVR